MGGPIGISRDRQGDAQGRRTGTFFLEFFDNYGEATARGVLEGAGFSGDAHFAHAVVSQHGQGAEGFEGEHGVAGVLLPEWFFYGDGLLSVDSQMDFSPVQPPAEFPDKNYSVRWTGQLAPPHTEDYTFRIQTDEGVRLWVGGRLVINELSNRTQRTFSGTAPLQRGTR